MSGYLHRLDREKKNTDFIMIGTESLKERKIQIL